MKLDIRKLKSDIRANATLIHDLKKKIRVPHRIITWQEWGDLVELKDEATLLCSIRAWSRGRLHRKFRSINKNIEGKSVWVNAILTKDDQQRLVGNVCKKYELPEVIIS